MDWIIRVWLGLPNFWVMVLFLLNPVVSHATSQAKAQFEYVTNAGTITVTKYVGDEPTVIVPEDINGISITRIGPNAFYRCGWLTNVTLSASVVLIESRRLDSAVGAFAGCSNLMTINADPRNSSYSSIDGVLFDKSGTNLLICPEGRTAVCLIPNGVTHLVDRAFAGCANLLGVSISQSVVRMGDRVFAGCKSLANIIIPEKVARIGEGTFAGCSGLGNISISSQTDTIEVGAFSECSSLTNIIIPQRVNTVGPWAFSGCATLTNVVIPEKVTSLGSYAFAGCAALSAISVDPLNQSYSSIDGVLFDKDRTTLLRYPENKAGDYVVPAGITRIEVSAFSGCGGLTGIVIPNGVTTIGDRAFFNCYNLTNVVIPDGLTNIGSAAFASCGRLVSIAIPTSIDQIEGAEFSDCTNLALITIPSSVSHIGDSAFSQCNGLVSVSLPKSIIEVGTAAFQSCVNLENIVIGGNLASLGNAPFYNCSNLNGLYFEGDVPSGPVGASALTLFNANHAIVYHLFDTIGWSSMFGGRPTALWMPRLLQSNPDFAGSGEFGFSVVWASGRSVAVEACTNLIAPAWSPVGTNTLTDGSAFFTDPDQVNHSTRFYRLRVP